MPVNRIWRSIGTAAMFLLAIALVGWIVGDILGLIGLLLPTVASMLSPLIRLVPLAGVFLYLDWRWGWKPENIGLPRNRKGLMYLAGGLAAGIGVSLLALLVSALLGGSLPAFQLQPLAVGLGAVFGLVTAVLTAILTEMLFRGGLISRLQTDLDPKEVLLISLLAPVVVGFIQDVLRIGFNIPTGTGSLWQIAMSAALVLLFLRTDSTWLTIGIAVSVLLTGRVLPFGEQGALLVWSVIAVILFLLEWRNYGRLGRPPGGRRGPQRAFYGKVHRGPWGPH